MRVMFAKRFLLLFLLTIAFPAEALEGLEAARDAYRVGEFGEAADMARGLGTAESGALAARAELAEGDFLAPPSSRRDYFERAAEDARAAIARDPRKKEAHLYLALALGFLGRLDGSIAAHFAGYAEEAREHIDQALALAPTDPWANALLGGWNLEIVRDGGVFGEKFYGASLEKGISAYTYALALDAGNAAIAYQYSLQLIALGGAWRRAEAREVLAGALRSSPDDAFETLAHRRAERLVLMLDAHNEDGLHAILRDQLGLADPIRSAGAGGPNRSIGSPR